MPDGAQHLVRGTDGNDETGPAVAMAGTEEGIAERARPGTPRPRKLVKIASGTFGRSWTAVPGPRRPAGTRSKDARLGVLDGDRRLHEAAHASARAKVVVDEAVAPRGDSGRARSRMPRSSQTDVRPGSMVGELDEGRPSRCAAPRMSRRRAGFAWPTTPAAPTLWAASISSIAASGTRCPRRAGGRPLPEAPEPGSASVMSSTSGRSLDGDPGSRRQAPRRHP